MSSFCLILSAFDAEPAPASAVASPALTAAADPLPAFAAALDPWSLPAPGDAASSPTRGAIAGAEALPALGFAVLC